MADEVRLNKALADAGLCSRRKADELIFAGQVTVNGKVADSPGLRVTPGQDEVICQGKAVKLRGGKSAGPGKAWKPCLLMLHKPVEVVSTVSDPQGRKTVLDLLPDKWRGRRLYPVGRLDYFSEGLILVTDDGELANRLMHPRWHLPRIYEVRVRADRSMDEAGLESALRAMRSGMTLAEGERLAPVQAELVRRSERELILRLELRQGLNRQIRRMCRDLGLTILKLKRVEQGPLKLGDLALGRSRELDAAEEAALRAAVGLK